MKTLDETHPEIISQWDYEANYPLTPNNVTAGSGKKVWWKCQVANDHRWEATISNKAHGTSCPCCCGQKAVQSNCLSTTHPILVSQWDYEANHPLTPNDVVSGSHTKVWWKCPVANDHRWEAIIQNRTQFNQTCPCCCNRKTVPSNNLATTHPELTKQWHPSLNKIDPTEITAGYASKVWWKCSAGEDHIWKTQVNSRTIRGDGCPYCGKLKASKSDNLAIDFPKLILEWDYERNNTKPNDFLSGSGKKVWWKCNKSQEHRWQATIDNRTHLGHPCPYCAGKKADNKTSLLAKYSNICKEWDDETDPNTILPNSHKKFWWKCQNDPTHRWKANPNSRTFSSSGCPYCCWKISKGEVLIREFLMSLKIEFSQEYRIPDCKYKKQLPFDFAIHLSKLKLIEFQGGQHFAPVKRFGGERAFKNLQIRDKIKKDYCKKHNIPFLEIRYDEVKEIPKLINDFINCN